MFFSTFYHRSPCLTSGPWKQYCKKNTLAIHVALYGTAGIQGNKVLPLARGPSYGSFCPS